MTRVWKLRGNRTVALLSQEEGTVNQYRPLCNTVTLKYKINLSH